MNPQAEAVIDLDAYRANLRLVGDQAPTAALLAVGVVREQQTILVGFAVTALIYLTATTGRMDSWLSGRFFQYFGRISYSLYLVHLPILTRVYRAGTHITGLSLAAGILWLLIGTLLSIATAHLLNKYVEEPCKRLSSRRKPRKVSPAQVEAPAPRIAQEHTAPVGVAGPI